jgi:hypothetical protein
MGFYRGPNIVTNGLVLALDAGNIKSYQSGSTTWYDKSGNNNNGTLLNGIGYSSSYNGVLSFDGSDDRMRLGSSVPLTTSCTFNQWIQPLSGSATTMTTLTYYTLGTAKTLLYSQLIKSSGIWYHQTLVSGYPTYPQEMNVYFQSNVTQFVQNNTPYNSSFTWERITGVGSTLKTYINGVFREQLINTNDYWANTASLETPKYEIAVTFKGNIGTTSFYNRALSAEEILQNYNATKGRYNL